MSTSATIPAPTQNTVEEIVLNALPILEALGLKPNADGDPIVKGDVRSDGNRLSALYDPDIPTIAWW